MTFIEADGVRTHVESWAPEAPTRGDILLIHGASSDIGVFKPTIAPMLSRHFRVAAYDRPGMGFTTQRPADADTLKRQADVAAGVIDAMGLDRPIVVAHSFGGAVALRLALDHPEKISGLVLLAPVAYDWPGGVSWHLYWSANPVVGGLFNHVVTRPFADAAVKQGMVAAFAPATPPEGFLEQASVTRAAHPPAMKANADDLVSAKREVIAQQGRYPDLKMPIAILSGDSDSVVLTSIHSEGLKATLPGTRLVILPNVGHLPQESAPDMVMDLVDWVAARRN